MKKIALFSVMLFANFCVKAQQPLVKQYIIDINPQSGYKPKQTNILIQNITVSDSVFFISAKNRFLVYTKKELNQNIIEGKLIKNASPMISFQYVGESSKDLLK